MTSQEILEYNKRCAEFLGLQKETRFFNLKTGSYVKKDTDECDSEPIALYVKNKKAVPDLKFHSDWNWIMEVVEKIQTLDRLGGIVMIQQGRCKITSRMAGDHSVYADVSNYYLQGMKGQKEAVVEAINQFLIWYNKNN